MPTDHAAQFVPISPASFQEEPVPDGFDGQQLFYRGYPVPLEPAAFAVDARGQLLPGLDLDGFYGFINDQVDTIFPVESCAPRWHLEELGIIPKAEPTPIVHDVGGDIPF